LTVPTNKKTSHCKRDSEGFIGKLHTGLIACLLEQEQGAVDSQSATQTAKTSLLVALSGGGDSTALLLALVELAKSEPYEIFACHINHKLRGAAAEEDERFCHRLCEHLSVPLLVHSIDRAEFRRQSTSPSEEILRQHRYALLVQAAGELASHYIVTAHVSEDQAETMLFRLLRGTSLRGLLGIKSKRKLAPSVYAIRPLLSVSKRECRQYLAERGVSPRYDESNDDPAYSRNFLRHIITPKLLERFPSFAEHLETLSQIIGAEESYWLSATAATLTALTGEYGNENVWSLPQFQNLPLALKRRVLAEFMRQRQIEVSFARIAAIIDLLAQEDSGGPAGESHPGSVLTLDARWRIRSACGQIHWLKESAPPYLPLEDKTVRVPGMNMALGCGKILKIEILDNARGMTAESLPKTNALEVIVDLAKVKAPLVLRSRRQGDVITPFGMQTPVKLKKYLHTHKTRIAVTSLEERQHITLLADQEEVLWVPGVGMSERLRVTGSPSHRLSWLSIAPDGTDIA
jgi:tRNA(Ile)-lysidine synthase